MTKEIIYRNISELKKLPNNPRTIKKDDFEKLKSSLRDNLDYFEARPLILSDRTGDMVVIAGNQRYEAAKALGMSEVPTILLDNLSEEREREIIIRDNVSNGDWDFDILADSWNVDDLKDWGVDLPDWDENTTEYQKFVDKFKPKLTTDDCYTPPKVYEAVEKWVRNRYDIASLETIRPFKPDGDYQAEDYTGKVVIDNPPFSILSAIVSWYEDREVKFFLFAPHLTLLSIASKQKITKIVCGASTVYENGAVVPTSFITNLESPEVRVIASYDLYKLMEEAQPDELPDLERYDRPKNCKVSADFMACIKAHKDRVFTDDDLVLIRNLEGVKAVGKTLYGGGALLSDNAADKLAADKLAADKLAADKKAIKVELSPEELKIVEQLNRSSRYGRG